LRDRVTWYKITHAGEQVAQCDFQNNAIRTSPPGPAFVFEVPLHKLLTSMCDFVPCDRIVERAYQHSVLSIMHLNKLIDGLIYKACLLFNKNGPLMLTTSLVDVENICWVIT